MSGILIVAFLANCSQNLLLCDEIDTRHLTYSDMADCRRALTHLVKDHQERSGETRVVLGKCQYRLLEPASDREIAELPNGRRIRRLSAIGALQNPSLLLE